MGYSPDLAFTTAVYQLDRSNVINSVVGGQTFLTKGQRTEGVEVGLAGQLTPNWSVMGGYAYQVGKLPAISWGSHGKGQQLRSFRVTPSQCGAAMMLRPCSAWLWGDSPGRHVCLTDQPGQRTRFHARRCGAFAQFTKRFRGQLNIENLFDTRYFAAAHNDFNITPGSPIAVRATLIANF